WGNEGICADQQMLITSPGSFGLLWFVDTSTSAGSPADEEQRSVTERSSGPAAQQEPAQRTWSSNYQ
ncbi:hypothetical protein JOQ06_018149, partial [Pogonophryne albipinna]